MFPLPTAAQVGARTKQLTDANPGWVFNLQPNGRRFTAGVENAHPLDLAGATAFLKKNAVALGLDPNDAAAFQGTVDERSGYVVFGPTRWGKYPVGDITFAGSSLAGIYLGALGAPPAELDDAALMRSFVGRQLTVVATSREVPLPCDPGPNHTGCSGKPGPPEVRRSSMTLDAAHVKPLGRAVRGVQASPSSWELRVVARFAPEPMPGPCRGPYGDHTRAECTVSYEVDGKPVLALVVDATSGEDLTGRALVF